MWTERFTERKSGRLEPIGDGLLAFVPNPLPPQLDWTDELVARLGDAREALARLEEASGGLGADLVSGLTSAFSGREAVLSSRIEGTVASVGEVLLFREDAAAREQRSARREVWNHWRALRDGLKRMDQPGAPPLSKRLLQELHATLLSGVRGRDRTPGEFRKLQNHIGAPGSTIDEASFVPPPPPEMISALNELELYLHTPSPLHTLVRAALVHYQFEAIHPFSDGNGRIGRLLIPLLLHNDRVLTRPLLYLSAYFERTREEYCRRLFEVSSEGRWLEWLVYFLKGVAGQARDALRRCQRLIELLDRYKETVEKPGRSALAVKLVEHLFEEPYLTIGEAAGALEIGFASATRLVMQLVGAGVLMEVTGQRRNRIFGAEEIVRLIEAELPEE